MVKGKTLSLFKEDRKAFNVKKTNLHICEKHRIGYLKKGKGYIKKSDKSTKYSKHWYCSLYLIHFDAV